MIIIQHIETIWTKESRGAPRATKRNCVPKRVKIEGTPSIYNEIYIHHIKADEAHNFSLHQDFYMLQAHGNLGNKANKNKHYSHIKFFEEAGKWSFVFMQGMSGIWGPKRPNQQLFNLQNREWGCLLINHRYAGSVVEYGPIRYTQEIFNIGNIDQFNPNVFLEIGPSHYIDRLVQLF